MAYINVNDIKVYYEIHGQGEPLLLIHGLGSSTLDWEYQLDFLKAKYQVLIFDLRGHGKTDKPNTPYSVAMFAADTASLIRSQFPQGMHIFGHSLGGMIAFQLAVDAPELVKTLTVLNSAPAVIFPSVKHHLMFFLRTYHIKIFGMHAMSVQLSKMLFPEPAQELFRQKFVERWSQNDPKAYIHSLRAFRGWTVMHRLHSIICPKLMIAADQDYTPVSFKEYYTRLIPNAELAVIKRSRHISIVDQAEVFNNVLSDFLERQRLK